jgi:hypothetical protein
MEMQVVAFPHRRQVVAAVVLEQLVRLLHHLA